MIQFQMIPAFGESLLLSSQVVELAYEACLANYTELSLDSVVQDELEPTKAMNLSQSSSSLTLKVMRFLRDSIEFRQMFQMHFSM